MADGGVCTDTLSGDRVGNHTSSLNSTTVDNYCLLAGVDAGNCSNLLNNDMTGNHVGDHVISPVLNCNLTNESVGNHTSSLNYSDSAV